MSAEQNIETARQLYEAFGRGDVQAILDRVTDDVDWSTDAAIASAPWYGPRHGKDGVVSFFEAIGKTGPVTEFTPLAYASNDDGDVMVFIRYAFTVTATGKHVAMNMHHYWKFRDGKVVLRPQFRGHRAGRRGPDALTRVHKRRPGQVLTASNPSAGLSLCEESPARRHCGMVKSHKTSGVVSPSSGMPVSMNVIVCRLCPGGRGVWRRLGSPRPGG